MLLALRETLRLQPRSTPSEVTVQAFNTVPAVPRIIKKVETLFEISDHDRDGSRARRDFRLFKRHQTNRGSIPITIPRQARHVSITMDSKHTAKRETLSVNIGDLVSTSHPLTASEETADRVIQVTTTKVSPLEDAPIESTPDKHSNQIASRLSPEADKLSSPSRRLYGGSRVEIPEQDAEGTISGIGSSIRPEEGSTEIDMLLLHPKPRLPLRRIGQSCYRAIDVAVPHHLELTSNPKLKKCLESFLKSLELQNRSIVLDCVMASSRPDSEELKATILFLCLNLEQQRTISSALKQRSSRALEVVPSLHYRYNVLVQETRPCSTSISVPSNPGPLSGDVVGAILRSDRSLCGVICSVSEFWTGAQCTLGGLIAISGSVYGLTTSHAFLEWGQNLQAMKIDGVSEPIGNIHSYKLTEALSSSSGFGDQDLSSEMSYDQDWALIRIQPSMYNPNIFQLPGSSEPIFIEDYVPNEDLVHGPVHILSGTSGVCEGYLSPSAAYWMFGRSYFEVRTVFLDKQLNDGDSGSWVVRGGRLCGYIISKAVGMPWGYMLPVAPVISDILGTISPNEHALAEILSDAKIRELQQREASFGSPPTTHHIVESASSPGEGLSSSVWRTLAVAPEFPEVLQASPEVLAQTVLDINQCNEKIATEETKPHRRFKKDHEEMSEWNFERLHGLKLAALSLALYLSVLSVAIHDAMISVIIPKITTHFKSLDDVGLYMSVHLLTFATYPLAFTKLYTHHVIKLAFIWSQFIFMVGNLLCGFATSSTMLIIGRAFAGAGSAGVYLGAPNLVSYSTGSREPKPKQHILFGAMFAISFIAGPIIGGALADRASWRWCFYIHIPVAPFVILIVAFLFRSPEKRFIAWKKRIQELDIEGLLTLIAASICLQLALRLGGRKYAWNSPRIIILFIGFGFIFGVFVGVQAWKKDNAMIPPKLLAKRSMVAAIWFSFAMGSAFEILRLYLSIWFQVVKQSSALNSGLMILPVTAGLGLGSGIAQFGVSMIRYYTPFMIFSSILTAVGLGMISTFELDTNHAAWIGYTAMAGIGFGVWVNMPYIAVPIVFDSKHSNRVPVGIAVINFARCFGGMMFVSISQNLFINKLVSGLKELLPTLDSATILSEGASGLEKSIPQFLERVEIAYNDGLNRSFLLAAGIAGISIVGSLAMEWKSTIRKMQPESSSP